MPTTLNPNPASGTPQTLSTPANGELADAPSVDGAFQRLLDGSDIYRKCLFGARVRPRYFTTSASHVTVQPLGYLMLTTGGGALWTTVLHDASSDVDLLATLGGNFVAKTRYYLYIYSSAGTFAWNLSTTAPDIYLRYRSDSTDYVYVGTFLASSTTAVHSCQESGGGVYKYNDNITALSAGTDTTGTVAVPVANITAYGPVVPSFARTLLFRLELDYSAAAGRGSFFETTGAPSTGIAMAVGSAATSPVNLPDVQMTPADGANLYYLVDVGVTATIYLLGWLDPR